MNKLILCGCSLLMMISVNVQAQSSLSIGVSLNGGGWSGDNGSGNGDFESDKGGQFGFSISYNEDRFYAGVSLQGGDYTFNNEGPRQVTQGSSLATSDVVVKHSDFDLLAGYYFWRKVSLFVDLKATGSQWRNNDYEQGFSGLGLGVTGYHPLNEKWTLYGSWGLVGGKVRDQDKTRVGEASSSALTVAANYRLGKNNHLNMGVRFRNYQYQFDDGSEPEHSLNGIFFGFRRVYDF